MEDSLGWGWLNSLHPDDRERVRQGWAQATPGTDDYQVEYRLRRHDGQYQWLLVRAVPRLNEAGQVTLWVGGGTDIHDQKELVRELTYTNE